jgi:hypothetical protein
MLEFLKYFHITTDVQLVSSVAVLILVMFALYVMVPYLKEYLHKMVRFLRFSPPELVSVSGQTYDLGDRKLLRIEYEVYGANKLTIPDLNTDYNFSSKNGVSRRNNTVGFPVGKLNLQVLNSTTEMKLLFSNFWGVRSVTLELAAVSSDSTFVSGQPTMSPGHLLYMGYLLQVKNTAHQLFPDEKALGTLLENAQQEFIQMHSCLKDQYVQFTRECSFAGLDTENRTQQHANFISEYTTFLSYSRPLVEENFRTLRNQIN